MSVLKDGFWRDNERKKETDEMSSQLPVKWELGLTFGQLREANIKRCMESYHPVKDWSPAEWLMCLTGEVGELAHLLKQHRRGAYIDKRCLANELADVAIYLDLLAAALGIDLGASVARKFNHTSDMIDSKIKLDAEGPRFIDGFFLLHPDPEKKIPEEQEDHANPLVKT